MKKNHRGKSNTASFSASVLKQLFVGKSGINVYNQISIDFYIKVYTFQWWWIFGRYE